VRTSKPVCIRGRNTSTTSKARQNLVPAEDRCQTTDVRRPMSEG
jgi:hypothetical protein